MGFKKETKKKFNLIENILLKNATQRIKDLEDKTRFLEEKLQQLEEVIIGISSLSNEIPKMRTAMRRLENEMEKEDGAEKLEEISAEDLKILFSQQKKYIDNRVDKIEKNQLTYNTVNELISNSCSDVLKEIKAQIHSESKVSSATIEVDYNRINQQIALSVSQVFASDNRIAQINNLLLAEKEKNKQYEKIIADLYVRIEALEKKETKSDINIPSVYDSPEPPAVVHEQTFSETNNIPTVSVEHTPLFTLSNTVNIRRLDKIKDNALNLKKQYESILLDDEDNVYFKTVDKLITKISKLAEKCSDDELEPSALSGEFVKIINATIMKNFANKKLFSVIDSFMVGCGTEKKVLDVGQKLGDEDFELIGDMIINVPVNAQEQHNTIVNKIHDAYIVYYKDEDGLNYRVIDGQYTIGKFVK